MTIKAPDFMQHVPIEDTNSSHITRTDLMIVEDNDTDFALLRRAIKKRLPNTRVHRVATHGELVTKLLKQSFDLYIVDMGLPDAIGNTTIAYIRSNNETIPIIALTGTGSIEYAVFALKAGASNFFEKSVPAFAKVADHIANFLEASRASQQRNKTLAELESLKTRFQDYAEAASDWFWEKDANLNYTFLSAGVTRVTGITPAAMIGRRIWDVFSGADEISRADHQRDVEQHRIFRDYICDIVRPDGTMCTVRISGKPIFDEMGRFVGYRGVGSDITKEIDYQRNLANALVVAEKANRAQAQFFAVMSHELRTPLNAIIGFSEVLGAGIFKGDAAREAEYLDHITRAGRQLLSLVNDILDLSQLKADGRKFNFERLRLGEVIKESIAVVAVKAKTALVTIENHYTPLDYFVRGDDRALHQIIQNVLVNAVKFSPAGSHVTVDCSQVGRFARISIKDTGIGMDVATIARATEPFFQADDAMSRRNEGSGLGLAIINELVKAHSGKLEIESALGKGTRVDISIPLWSEP